MPVTKELEDVQAHGPLKFPLDKVSTYLNFLLHFLWHCFSFFWHLILLYYNIITIWKTWVYHRGRWCNAHFDVASFCLHCHASLRQALKVCERFPISEDVRQSCQGLPVFSFTLSFSHLSEYSHFSLWRCIQTCPRSVWFLSRLGRNAAQACSIGTASEGQNASNVNVTLRQSIGTRAYDRPSPWPRTDFIVEIL